MLVECHIQKLKKRARSKRIRIATVSFKLSISSKILKVVRTAVQMLHNHAGGC